MKKHIRLLIGFFGLMTLCSLALLPDATLAMLSVMLALSLNLILFKFLKPFDSFEITRVFDKYQVMPPEDINTTLSMKYNGRFPANASVEFDCRSLGLNINTGTVVASTNVDARSSQTPFLIFDIKNVINILFYKN